MRTILPEKENPVLREVAREIPPEEIKGPRIKKLVEEMKALLAKEEYGVALAAPQVGESLRLFIVSGRALARGSRNAPDLPAQADEPSEASAKEDSGPSLPDQVYINPVMSKMSREKRTKHEGCLSVRGKWGEVRRAQKVTLEASDEHGERTVRGASGFLAHIFQHEMDHLEGILYTDKATRVYDDEEK